ncbi:MAG: phage portal protein, partial [Gemmatimonadaceae bacterium]|nr:phage portal protein [Gemmatimonadaceae bacterium]
MGILSSIFERRAADFHPSASPPSWWLELFGGGVTKAGVRLNEWQVLQLSTVWCCVSSIAIDIASLPFHVYRRLEGNAREKDTSHPAWYLIEVEPNPEMDAISFWDTLQWWTLNWGNGLAEIERRGNGQPKHLWPLEPWCTSLERVGGRLVYTYTPRDGKERTLPAEDVLH